MNDFKQIIGRGTRTFEGKDFFIIWDFVKAHENFNDPKWDGEPEEPVQPVPHINDPSESQEPELPPETIIIKLADGEERTIQYTSATIYWNADGNPMTAEQFIKQIFGDLAEMIAD